MLWAFLGSNFQWRGFALKMAPSSFHLWAFKTLEILKKSQLAMSEKVSTRLLPLPSKLKAMTFCPLELPLLQSVSIIPNPLATEVMVKVLEGAQTGVSIIFKTRVIYKAWFEGFEFFIVWPYAVFHKMQVVFYKSAHFMYLWRKNSVFAKCGLQYSKILK